MTRFQMLSPAAALFLAASALGQVETQVVTVTQNGPSADPNDFIEFFLVPTDGPCAPVLTDCFANPYYGSTIFNCGTLDADGMAAAIAGGPAVAGVTFTVAGNVVTIDVDTAVTGGSLFACINMIECPAPFGYVLGGANGCPINNVCSGVCGDEDQPPGATGFNFSVGEPIETEIVKITRNGPPFAGSVIEFFLVTDPHDCAPTLANCVDDDIAGSGLIDCSVDVSPNVLASSIADGLTMSGMLPAGVTVTAAGNLVTIENDLALSGASVYLCINMSECAFPFGYGLGGPMNCEINNVCSGVCGDEDQAPGAAGYNFCTVEPLGTPYCVGAPNSVGPGGAISALGSASVTDQSLALVGSGLFNGPGLFYYGGAQIQAPFGDGFRCIGGSTTRIQPPVQASGNTAVRQVNFGAPSAAGIVAAGMASQALNFQLWYRDPMGPGGTGFNLTDAIEIPFTP